MNQHFTQLALREATMDGHGPAERAPGVSVTASPASKNDPSFSTTAISSLRDWLRHLFGQKTSDATLKEVLEEVLEEHHEEAERLAPQEKTMLRNVLSFGDMSVSDIMIPRTDISAVPYDITPEALKAHIHEYRHTRIPVYRETLDQVEGFLHIKDLFPMMSGDEAFSLKKALRPMLFVPASMRITDLLVKMRRIGSHMAIVVDEYGGTDGLVTLEDLFEEIVGDIQDEHDEDQDREFFRLSDHVAEADARIRVEKLEDYLDLTLRTGEEGDEYDTLGGLIFYELGRVPVVGEKIPHASGLTFEIMDADARRVKKVRILNAEPVALSVE